MYFAYILHSCYITSNHSKFWVRYLSTLWSYQWKYPASLNKDFYFIHLSFYEIFLEYSYQKRNVSWISLKNCSSMELKVLCLTWYIQRNELVPNANLERISPKCSRGSNWAYLNWNYVRTAKKMSSFFQNLVSIHTWFPWSKNLHIPVICFRCDLKFSSRSYNM